MVIEALASGTPIVATDCCVSMAELLGHGRLGDLTPPGDVEALAAAMQRAPGRPRDVAAMQSQAGRFTIERSGQAYLDLMAGLVDKAPLALPPWERVPVGQPPALDPGVG